MSSQRVWSYQITNDYTVITWYWIPANRHVTNFATLLLTVSQIHFGPFCDTDKQSVSCYNYPVMGWMGINLLGLIILILLSDIMIDFRGTKRQLAPKSVIIWVEFTVFWFPVVTFWTTLGSNQGKTSKNIIFAHLGVENCLENGPPLGHSANPRLFSRCGRSTPGIDRCYWYAGLQSKPSDENRFFCNIFELKMIVLQRQS